MGTSGESVRALVADDNDMTLAVVVRLLERLGFESVQASDGTEAMRLYSEQSEAIDLVMIDFEMPGLNGLEICRRIKERDPSQPVVVCSGSAERALLEDKVGDSGALFLAKPFDFAGLQEAVQAVMGS